MMFREVNGAAHIARLIEYRDDPFKEGRRLAKLDWPRVPPSQGDFLAGLIGPILVTEYLPNGTLARLIETLQAQNAAPTPNRVLWALYSCVVRACIGMAYPLSHTPSQPPQLETIPEGIEELDPIVHADAHVQNVMFGDINPGFPEHGLIPVRKLIDFGEAFHDERLATGPPGAQNIFDTARLIYNLIRRLTSTDNPAPDGPEHFSGILTRAVNLSDQRPSNREVDMELQDTICWAMAEIPAERPNLTDLLERVTFALTHKTADSLSAYGTAEANADIIAFVQTYILDADPGAPEERNLTPPTSDTSTATGSTGSRAYRHITTIELFG
ncbi:hypothetical protein GGR57DRAFT_466588 [Xylariaceae sp. FL1272]|nr:hypothetical protein GGR57DRAFT_466588 [Xylariaceae sp. FL1272]